MNPFLGPNLQNNQLDILKFFWRHGFVKNKLDPRRLLKMVDETPVRCIFIF